MSLAREILTKLHAIYGLDVPCRRTRRDMLDWMNGHTGLYKDGDLERLDTSVKEFVSWLYVKGLVTRSDITMSRPDRFTHFGESDAVAFLGLHAKLVG